MTKNMKRSKNISLYLAIIIISSFIVNYNLFSQEKKTISFRDRLFFGGNLALQFGSITNVEIAPISGYRFTPKWCAGIGLKYQYYAASRDFGDFSTSIYGGSVFTEYLILKDVISRGLSLMTHAEDETLSMEKKYFREPFTENGRFVLNSVLIGGGIKQYMGGRTSMYIIMLWDINQTTYSPYQNPTVRIGVNF